jgi:hypothetical protein
MGLYEISDVNPNEATGGGGCACHESKASDTEGPFVIFYTGESASTISPHVVVCARCIRSAGHDLVRGDHLAAGEQGGVEETTSDPTAGSTQTVASISPVLKQPAREGALDPGYVPEV